MSYTKIEHAIMPDFRNKVNHAESTEDIKKFFGYKTQELLNSVFAGRMSFNYDDILLDPENDQHFKLHNRLLASRDFNTVWNDSDLPQVVGRLAKSAANRFTRLTKNSEKTEAKIRM